MNDVLYLHSVKIYYHLSIQRSSKSEWRNRRKSEIGAVFNARRRQMAATHEHNIHTSVNCVLESLKSPSCLACLFRLIILRLSRADTLNPTCQTPMWLDVEADVSRVSNCRIFIIIRGITTAWIAFAVFAIRPSRRMRFALFRVDSNFRFSVVN